MEKERWLQAGRNSNTSAIIIVAMRCQMDEFIRQPPPSKTIA
jgi:hypothetical protein